MISISLLIAFFIWTIWLWKTYRAKNTRQLRILIIVPSTILLIATITITITAFNYPTEWNDKILGKKRTQVHRQLGEPTVGDMWEVKADIWFKENIYSWHRMDVIYNTDTICNEYMVAFYIGGKTEFIKLNLKNSFE